MGRGSASDFIGLLAALACVGSALLAVAVGLVLTASGAKAGDGPVATKSGALVNYVTGGKLKVRKRIEIVVVCSANCDITSTLNIKGPGVKLKGTVSGQLNANIAGATYLKLKGPRLQRAQGPAAEVRAVRWHHRL